MPTFGALGDIFVMWDKRVVKCIEEVVGTFSISCKFKNVLDRFIWAFSRVHGPNADCERHYLWEELLRVFNWWEVPWCIGGDFNVICCPNERVGATRLTIAILEFLDFISDQGLMDILFAGGAYTWSNNQDPPVMSRIDRFLVSLDEEEYF